MSGNRLPPPGALSGSDWLTNELGDLSASMRSMCHGSTEDRHRAERLITQALIHTALMEEVVYPALRRSQENVPPTYQALHQALRDAADAVKPEDEIAEPRVQALLEATAALVAHESRTVAEWMRAPGIDGMAIGALLAKRQEELMTAGPAR